MVNLHSKTYVGIKAFSLHTKFNFICLLKQIIFFVPLFYPIVKCLQINEKRHKLQLIQNFLFNKITIKGMIIIGYVKKREKMRERERVGE